MIDPLKPWKCPLSVERHIPLPLSLIGGMVSNVVYTELQCGSHLVTGTPAPRKWPSPRSTTQPPKGPSNGLRRGWHNNLNLAVHFAFGEPSTSYHLHEAFAIVFVLTNLFVLLHFIYPPSNSFVRSSCSVACATPTATPKLPAKLPGRSDSIASTT
jgi:hypothetical protein